MARMGMVAKAVLGVGAMSVVLAGENAAARVGFHLDLGPVEAVDLTHPMDSRTIYWPTSPSQFELKTLQHGTTGGGYFYASNAFCTPEHGGTHLDAPLHFAEDGRSADQIPLEQAMGPAVVMDVSARAALQPDYRLTPEDVHTWEQRYGRVPEGSMVLLRTGWEKRWPDKKLYLGDDTPGDASNLHFPSFGKEAAQLLVHERKVVLLGVDTASIDHGPSKDFPVHRVAGAANVLVLENLANLEHVPATGAWVMALPLKIAGGTGGPVRAVALVPQRGE